MASPASQGQGSRLAFACPLSPRMRCIRSVRLLPSPLEGSGSGQFDAGPSGCLADLMQATIDLPDNLHQVVTSIAAHSHRSMNPNVADLIRRELAPCLGPLDAVKSAALRIDEGTGLPVIRSLRPVTAEDVRALENE